MSNKNNQLADLPLEAKALENANKTIGNSTNKLLYILVVEDPTVKQNCRIFATSKVDKMAAFADIIGYEITNAQSNKLKTWDDVIELANDGNIELINISFPWHRVINIRNVTYKSKSA